MDSTIENANNEANKPSFFSRIKNMSRENMFLFGIMGITIGMIAGLTTGIVLSQNDRASLGSYRRAIDILESYPLVDGYRFSSLSPMHISLYKAKRHINSL